MDKGSLQARLELTLQARGNLFDEGHESALRLFNGFYEGCPDLVVDLYARTLLIHNYADPPADAARLAEAAAEIFLLKLPWLIAIVVKARNAKSLSDRRGQVVYGESPDSEIHEGGLRYAIDMSMSRDASFYLDTRNLRAWARDHLAGKTVLNTFAYSGSLGVAAMGGGAQRVVHMDLKREYLNLAKRSYTLNGFPIHKKDFITSDFFPAIGRLKRSGKLFDCVFLDPPFFSRTKKGSVYLSDSTRLINKVRPLIRDGGWLAAVNNALYLSGREYMAELQDLCRDGFLRVEQLVPVPDDITGYPETRVGNYIADPSPFNHPTKIALLAVRRKSSK